MRVYKIADTLVVLICLPFYAIVFPLMAISDRLKLNRIRKTACLSCGAPLVSIRKVDLVSCVVKFTLARGTRVDWDRLPMTKVICPACHQPIFSDRRLRHTSGDYSVHMQCGLG